MYLLHLTCNSTDCFIRHVYPRRRHSPAIIDEWYRGDGRGTAVLQHPSDAAVVVMDDDFYDVNLSRTHFEARFAEAVDYSIYM